MYLLDANVIITAHRDYYAPDLVPQFWDWLWTCAENGDVKLPRPIYDEIMPQDDDLKRLMQLHKEIVVLNDDDSDQHVPDVLECYAPDLTAAEIEKIGADPFLIACGLHYEATVVSKEGRSNAQRAKRKIPDICVEFDVRCISDFTFFRELGFKA